MHRHTMTGPWAFVCLLSALLLPGCQSAPRTPAAPLASLLASYSAEHPFPNSSFMEVSGTKLHFLRWEPPAGTVARGRILLVHGFAASVYCWRFLGPALADEGFEVLAVDHPPFGWSSPSPQELSGGEAGSPEHRAGLLWSFLDAVASSVPDGERRPWILIGHSLGGRITAWMASKRPGMTEALILLAPAVAGEMGPPGLGGTNLVQKWLSGNLRVLIHDESLVRSALAKAYGRKPTDEELAGYWAPFLREGAVPALAVWAREGVEKALPDFGAIRARTLVLWGTKDRVVLPAGKDIVRSIPASLFVSIADGSHCLMETQFAETWRAIEAFLAGISGGSGEGGAARQPGFRP